MKTAQEPESLKVIDGIIVGEPHEVASALATGKVASPSGAFSVPGGSVRTCAIDKIYLYHLKTGKGIRVIGYELWDVNSGERLKRTAARKEAKGYARRRGWILRDEASSPNK